MKPSRGLWLGALLVPGLALAAELSDLVVDEASFDGSTGEVYAAGRLGKGLVDTHDATVRASATFAATQTCGRYFGNRWATFERTVLGHRRLAVDQWTLVNKPGHDHGYGWEAEATLGVNPTILCGPGWSPVDEQEISDVKLTITVIDGDGAPVLVDEDDGDLGEPIIWSSFL